MNKNNVCVRRHLVSSQRADQDKIIPVFMATCQVTQETNDVLWLSKLHAEENLLCDRWRKMMLSAAPRLIFQAWK